MCSSLISNKKTTPTNRNGPWNGYAWWQRNLPRFSCFAGFDKQTHGPQSAIQIAQFYCASNSKAILGKRQLHAICRVLSGVSRVVPSSSLHQNGSNFRIMMSLRIAFVMVVVSITCASMAQETSDRNYSFSLGGAYLYGPIRGNIQTPLGGEPGTTSSHRPTLKEIGIDDTSVWDVNGEFRWRNERFYLGAQFIKP